jgi:hypothetical protein
MATSTMANGRADGNRRRLVAGQVSLLRISKALWGRPLDLRVGSVGDISLAVMPCLILATLDAYHRGY